MSERALHVHSIDELRAQMPSIIKKLNADQGLLRGAAANPIFALEELGYVIPDALRHEIETRVRFSAKERESLGALRRQVIEAAGFAFDLDSPHALESALFERLRIAPLAEPPVRVEVRPEGVTPREAGTSADTVARQRGVRASRNASEQSSFPLHRLAVRYHLGAPNEIDPLTELRDAHPVVAPLLAYRAIIARHAPLAPRALYDRIRAGDVNGPSITLRARFHRATEA